MGVIHHLRRHLGGGGKRGSYNLALYCYFADILLLFADEGGGGTKNPEKFGDAN